MTFQDMPQDAENKKLIRQTHPLDWKNPNPAPRYNLVVIGAGTAGLICAVSAAKLGAKVALIERNLMGGDCLNVGCIPSKSLIRSARILNEMRQSELYGVHLRGVLKGADFSFVMKRMRQIRARIAWHDSAERLRDLGVDVFFGQAQFLSHSAIGVDGEILNFKKAVIATGSRPNYPNIPGISDVGYLTNETVFNLTELPRRLMVIGGGPLGCELAQAFQRLGSQVTIVHQKPLFLPMEERDAAQLLSDSFARDGIRIFLNSSVKMVSKNTENEKLVLIQHDEYQETIAVDEILTGIGRRPNVEGLNLEVAGINYNCKNGILVNDFLQSSNNNVYAVGDACLEHKFTHTADASARIAVQNSLFMGRKRWSDVIVPWCTYTDPEVAHVGMYIQDAYDKNISIKTFTVPMHDVDRAIVDSEEVGFIKIHIKEGTDKILGATIVARHAGEMINEISLAIVAGVGLGKISDVIHSYPTQAEGIRKAADAYNVSRLTPFLKKLSTLWLRWTR